MDIKDILGVSRGAKDAPSPTPTPTPAKSRTKKPEGIKREVYMLMGKDATSIAPVVPVKGFKEKRKTRAAVWKWKAFTNPARADDLVLYHWERTDGPTRLHADGYAFAKFNKKIKMISYTNEEYYELCNHPEWSKEETDYLFSLCRRFDLRFVVIADRYDFPGRTRRVEELKDRYYSIAQRIVEARAPPDHHLGDHPLFKHAYNKEYDVERRRYNEHVYNRTKEQEAEDLRLQLEREDDTGQRRLERIAREQALIDMALAGAVTDPPAVLSLLTDPATQGRSSTMKRKRADFFEVFTEGAGAAKRNLTVTRYWHALSMFDGAKAKKLETVAQEFNCEKFRPKAPTARVQDELIAMRVEMLLLSKLRHMLDARTSSKQVTK